MKRAIFLLLLLAGLTGSAQDAFILINTLSSNKQKADTLMYFARQYIGRAKNDTAKLLLDRAREFALASDDHTIAKYYVALSVYNQRIGNYRQSINEGKKALPYFDGKTNLHVQSNCYYFIAKCYGHLRIFDSSHYYFALNEQVNNQYNPYRNWEIYAEKGRIFRDNKNFTLGEEYLEKAMAITKAGKSRMDYVVSLSYLEELYAQTKNAGKYALVVSEIDKAMASSKSSNSNPTHSLIFRKTDNMTMDEQVSFYTEVKNALLKDKDTMNAAYANSTISAIYEKSGSPALSVPFMKENMELTKNQGNLTNHFIYTKAVLRLLTKSGNHDEALKVSDYLFKLNDSIINKQQQEKLVEYETKYETEKKQKEIALLTSQHELNRVQLKAETEKTEALQRENMLKEEKLAKELLLRQAVERENILNDSSLAREQRLNEALGYTGRLKESELQKEKLLTSALSRENNLKQESINKDKKSKRTLWGGIGLLTLAGGIILWQFSRQVRKNRIIKKQAEEMEVLNREIHHRVKNNLQVISSLLDIQSQTLKDEEAAELLKESKQRVQSMAFIHQNLYQSNSVQEIEINNYINNLAEHLFQSYNIGKDKIRFSTDIDKISLHSDTVIPLGMILNELISNSLKYAFKDLEEGEIKVSMKQKENELLLQVKDNGRGLPAGFDISKLQSFGFKVIKAFAQKLKAKLTIDGSGGTDVQLLISKFKTI